MTFWALGAFDKVKNMTEKLNIKDVSKKVISYVAAQNESRQQQDERPTLYRGSLKQESSVINEPKKTLSSEQRMAIQLEQYKKLVKMQEQILANHYKKEKQALMQRQALLQKENSSLIELEEATRKEATKGLLINQIQSGEKSIQDVITENIMIKEKIILAKTK